MGPRELRGLETQGLLSRNSLRVSKLRRSHWTCCLTNLDSNLDLEQHVRRLQMQLYGH